MSFRLHFFECGKIAMRTLLRHRLRSFLTILGVGVGVATLLAIVGIIQGMNVAFEKSLSSFSSNVLFVQRMPMVPMDDLALYRNRRQFTLEQAKVVQRLATFAEHVEPLYSAPKNIQFLDKELFLVSIYGVTPNYLSIVYEELAEGRFLTQEDLETQRKVVVIGRDLVDAFFKNTSPLGASIRIAGIPFVVVGTFKPKGKLLGVSLDNQAIVPMNTYKAFWMESGESAIGVVLPASAEQALLEEELEGVVRRARQLGPGQPNDFSINRIDSMKSIYKSVTGALFGVAVGVGLITLSVGGIGIMNIMLVSVRERTREIGVRRALGARRSVIVAQFILEAVAVSMLGGAIGTGVGLLAAKIVSWTTPLPAVVHPLTVLGGVGFAALVGLFFGILPALRAANLNPIIALRHE
ncbi:MAG: ABC transporter permease [Cystobacterineae bacterium]|nr:ABC transporter permease [Cystobacterineae bacterium]